METIIDELAAVIGRRPCERCKQSYPEPPCSEHDFQKLYREEAEDVLEWIKKNRLLLQQSGGNPEVLEERGSPKLLD